MEVVVEERHVTFSDDCAVVVDGEEGATVRGQVLQLPEFVLAPESLTVAESDALGRGVYGEVFTARWRNAKVACKRLFSGRGICTSTSQQVMLRESADELRLELDALARLQHPNLVQFFGFAGGALSLHTDSPLLVVSELMTCSLHDLLEVQRYSLVVAEILDVSRGVCAALAFLHSHLSGKVVHGAVSSSNVLFRGNTAKLADLGHAALFRPAGHQGSGVARSVDPASPAGRARLFAAPELSSEFRQQAERLGALEKADMYALGVVIVHMASGEAPSECREQQLKMAVKKHRVLEGLMSACTSFLPSERPAADEVLRDLEDIMSNDRYYPPARRLAPESLEAGVWARRWSEQLLVASSESLSKKIHNSYALLQAEGRRWQHQTQRANTAEATVEQLESRLEYVSDALLQRSEDLEVATKRVAALEEELRSTGETAERHAAAQQAEKVRLADCLRELEFTAHDLAERVAAADTLVPELQGRLEQRDDALVQARLELRQGATERRELRRQFDEQVQEGQDLEVRLEQSLTRWKLEQEASQVVKLDFVKLRTTCSALITENKRLGSELQQTRAWLKDREEAQLPETVQRQMAELQGELQRSAAAGDAVLDAKVRLEANFAEQEQELLQLRAVNEERAQELQRFLELGKLRDATIDTLRSELQQTRAGWDKDKEEMRDKETLMKLQFADMVKCGKIVVERPGGSEAEEEEEDKKRKLASAAGMEEREEEAFPETRDGPSTKFNFADLVLATTQTAPLRHMYAGVAEGGGEVDAAAAARYASVEAQVRRDADKGAKLLVKHTAGTGGVLSLAQLFCEKWLDQDVVWRCARALRPLVSPDNNAQLCDLGLDVAAVDALNHHGGQGLAMPQSQVMQLLGALAYGSDLCRRRAGERGALTAIVAALTELADDEACVLHGLTAVTNLSHNSNDNRHRFLDAGGMAALVHAADEHIASVKVQRQACWALLTLAGADDTGRLVAQAGGGTTAVKAMLQHRSEPGVQQFGLWALCNMALAGGDVTRRLRKGGALEVCRIAIETHPGDKEVIRQARQMMGVLGPATPFLKGNAKV